jgi:hypothetical protein
MHQPPAEFLDGGERLTLEGFQNAFGETWRRLERRFVKVECWQSYREADGVRSQEAFQQGDHPLARRLLEDEAIGDRPLYDEIRTRGLDFSRIRLITHPLTEYLRYEMINYEVRTRLGERVELIRPPSPVEEYFDFLLFDSHAALIHDYGPGPVGRQAGGWLTHAPRTLDALAAIIDDLRAWGRPESFPDVSGGSYRE